MHINTNIFILFYFIFLIWQKNDFLSKCLHFLFLFLPRLNKL